ncbi:MlaD family protein [Hymenobacter sp. DH14]|uniref:MlaD family protein n=1 Tax=Hymenobacter cyanobacteriorum TaxID=2926463 RepID=A0A9X2AIH6_9BACT|nr:MlaD family protein [Hymenobacter cyanobacteriorum]MCI1188635.1 MlaD family protein [Hymenobacter cyanobacteriorum]
MPQRPTGNYVKLGLFVVVGTVCLLGTLFLLGRQQSLFSRSFVVRADFRNVSGLLTGNNVRLGGITVGTVRQIQLLNDSTVRVAINLNRDAQPFVRKNAVAAIGTDGLVGNTIINLTAQPGAAPAVQPGDLLHTRRPVGMDDLLSTFDVSNKNLVSITRDLRQITGRLNGSKALWGLLDDQQLADNLRHSLRNAAEASGQLSLASHDVARLTGGVRQGRGPLGYLLTDTAFAGRLGHASRGLAGTSDTLGALLANLKGQVANGAGPVHTLLGDTTASRQLRQTMHNVEQGTAGFNRSMEALQHNFLLRGYLRRQQKKQARAASATMVH